MAAARRSHTKSRRGCVACKRRHIKCDEIKPRCSYCIRLGYDCVWPKLPTIHYDETISTSPEDNHLQPIATNSPSSNFSGYSAGMTQSTTFTIEDLALMHHFVTVTYSTLDEMPEQWPVFQQSLVKIGFNYPYVLRAVMSLAALHQLYLSKQKDEKLLTRASVLFNQASEEFRASCTETNEHNVAAQFGFSFLAVIYAFASIATHEQEAPIQQLSNVLQLINGLATSLVRRHFETLLRTELAPLLYNVSQNGIEGEIPEVQKLNELALTCTDHERRATYLDAISQCHRVFLEAISSNQGHSALGVTLQWPAAVSSNFLKLIEKHDDIALIILAHFSVLLHLKRKFWWLSGSHEHLITSIEAELHGRHREWLQWPMEFRHKRFVLI